MDATRNARVDITKRTLEFGVATVEFCRAINRDHSERVLAKQLLRAATSIGANVHEAQGGQSKADFIAKMSIARKEALETAYWLKLIERFGYENSKGVVQKYAEAEELIKILSAILISARRRK